MGLVSQHPLVSCTAKGMGRDEALKETCAGCSDRLFLWHFHPALGDGAALSDRRVPGGEDSKADSLDSLDSLDVGPL